MACALISVAKLVLVMADASFEMALSHGRCVGIALPADEAAVDAMAAEELLPEERAVAAALSPVRRRTWVGGRVAMRRALGPLGRTAPPILADDRGAPLLPAGIVGSISHKEAVAVALVASERDGSERDGKVGIDVELEVWRARDIAAKVLRPEELAELESLPTGERAKAVLLRFSAKEAVYKALDPVRSSLRGLPGDRRLPRRGRDRRGETVPARGGGSFSSSSLRWTRRDNLLLTTARAPPSIEPGVETRPPGNIGETNRGVSSCAPEAPWTTPVRSRRPSYQS